MKEIRNGIKEPINPSTGKPYHARRREARGRDLVLLRHVKTIIINNLHTHFAANPGHGEEDFDYVNYKSVMQDITNLQKVVFNHKYDDRDEWPKVLKKMEAIDE